MHSLKIINLVTFFSPFQYKKVRESIIAKFGFFLLFFPWNDLKQLNFSFTERCLLASIYVYIYNEFKTLLNLHQRGLGRSWTLPEKHKLQAKEVVAQTIPYAVLGFPVKS